MGMTTAINQAMAEAYKASASGSRLLADGAIVGAWQVLALVGKGGCGEVYRVKHAESNAIGALKVLCRDDRRLRQRFELELEILQKTSSGTSPAARYFPRFMDSGILLDRNLPYLVMEFLSDFSFPEPPEPRMKNPQITKLILSLCVAIGELHKIGYLHRDIKPSNLMRRKNGEMVLIDFGLAIRIKDIENPLARRVSMTEGEITGVGTPGSTAPEQAFGNASVRGDVYSIGALASECFRGNPPAKWIPIIQKATNANAEFRYRDTCELRSAILEMRNARTSLILRIAAIILAISFAVYLFWIEEWPFPPPEPESDAPWHSSP